VTKKEKKGEEEKKNEIRSENKISYFMNKLFY